MQSADTKLGGNRLVPDIRSDQINTVSEGYNEETAAYKIINAHPIINGLLDKMAFVRTHAKAVWYNKLANKTVYDKIRELENMFPSGTVTVYVSPSGSDTTGDGSQEKPWRQISHAISAYRVIPVNVSFNIHVAAGTYNKFSVSGRRVTIYLEGNVTIDGGGNKCITVDQRGSCAVNASQANTYTLTLKNGTSAVYVSSISQFSMSAAIKKVILGSLTETLVYVSIFSFCSWNADFTVNSTCTGSIAFNSVAGSYLSMRLESALGTFDANTANVVYATQGGRAHIKNLNISNKCTNGLRATEGGQIYYTNVTNNAATPLSATTSGRIFAGTQTNVPNY